MIVTQRVPGEPTVVVEPHNDWYWFPLLSLSPTFTLIRSPITVTPAAIIIPPNIPPRGAPT